MKLINNDVVSLDDGDYPIVLGFKFDPLYYFTSPDYNTKIFAKHDEGFAEFVFNNRMNNKKGEKQHNFSIIYGVMSDSVPTESILQHKLGIKTKDEVIDDFKKPTSMKQISLHDQSICDILEMVEAYIIPSNNSEGRELDVNDYNE